MRSIKTAVVLRNQWARDWQCQGIQNWLSERMSVVNVNTIKLVAVYQPVSPNDLEKDEYRKTPEIAIANRKREEMLLIGGEHNSQEGRLDNVGKEKTVGSFGMRKSMALGEDLVECAEANHLHIVATYFRKNYRQTWCHPRTDCWYEHDYFLVK